MNSTTKHGERVAAERRYKAALAVVKRLESANNDEQAWVMANDELTVARAHMAQMQIKHETRSEHFEANRRQAMMWRD